jgi:hypothetical protein
MNEADLYLIMFAYKGLSNGENLQYDTLRMPSSGMLCHVAPVRTDVPEELITFIIRVTRISERETKF